MKVTTLQKLANAQTTYAGCGGHGKAARNKSLVEKWKKQLIAEGGNVPTNDELYQIGQFNGEGSC